MTTIQSIFRSGKRYHVVPECGHAFTVSRSDLDRFQFAIGKRIACARCIPPDERMPPKITLVPQGDDDELLRRLDRNIARDHLRRAGEERERSLETGPPERKKPKKRIARKTEGKDPGADPV